MKRKVAHLAPLTRLLFGVRVPHPTEQGHWDFATLVLFSQLKKRVLPGSRILEIGTGEAGTLSIAIARRVSAHYLALDLAEEAVVSARRVAAANQVTVEFLQSDLLTAVPPERSFELTFFNPPYLPLAQSAQWKPFGEPSRVFDGGEDGLDVIRKFFGQAKSRGPLLGTILIGINRQAVPEPAVTDIATAGGFSPAGVSRAFHPGTVLAFKSSRA